MKNEGIQTGHKELVPSSIDKLDSDIYEFLQNKIKEFYEIHNTEVLVTLNSHKMPQHVFVFPNGIATTHYNIAFNVGISKTKNIEPEK